jgi:hypothetical protein
VRVRVCVCVRARARACGRFNTEEQSAFFVQLKPGLRIGLFGFGLGVGLRFGFRFGLRV